MEEEISMVGTAGPKDPVGIPGVATPGPEEPERLFTQADLDAVLAKERAKAPTEEEMNSFRAWQESQKTERERQEQILNERNNAQQRVSELENALEQARREKLLLSKGIPEDDLDYYVYKIGKMSTDSVPFEKAAEKFFKEHAKTGNQVAVSFNAPASGNGSANLTGKSAFDALPLSERMKYANEHPNEVAEYFK